MTELDILGVLAIAQRITLIIVVAGVSIFWAETIWSMFKKIRNWRIVPTYLSFIFMAAGGGIISAVEAISGSGVAVSSFVELTATNVGLAFFNMGILTFIYSRAKKCGPNAAHTNFKWALALIIPTIVLVVILTLGGANE